MPILLSTLIAFASPSFAIATEQPEVPTSKICFIEHYDNIGLAYERLEDMLSEAIAKNRIQKPIGLPAKRSLFQVGQQHYAVCLIIETENP